LSEEQKAARAQALQDEIARARSQGGPDWDLDWATDPEAQQAHAAAGQAQS
jgi:hypothetical protein